jgi:tripartite-type tricarboxylate transporter receptor subunit TctC
MINASPIRRMKDMRQPNARGEYVAWCVLTFAAVASTLLPDVSARAADVSAPRLSKADDYPSKSIRVIDPFPAAGAGDIIARTVGQKFAERNGQAFVVDNRPGAGGNLAAEVAAKATPDGYTLFDVIVYSLAPSVSLYPKAGVDPMRDFAYITLLAGGSFVLIASPSFPAKTVAELVALAKSQPGKIGYASSGVGGPVHIAGELFNSRAGIRLLHVPYKGAAPIMTAVAGGEVPIGIPSVAGALPLIKAGRVVPIAVLGGQRTKTLPNVPTIAESGYPGYDFTPWYGIAAPAGTPNAVVRGLNVELGKIVQLPDVQATLAAQGLEATSSTPERLREIMREAIATCAKIIKDVGIKVD